MSSSAGRRSAEYVATRTRYQAGATCWMCGHHGRMTVDHVPPLATVGNDDALWKQLHHQLPLQYYYLPACQRCQSKQGAGIRNRNQPPDWTFDTDGR
jgi:hypothetical protein